MVLQTRRVGDKTFCEKEEVGRYYSVDEILEILGKERIFIEQSKGGVTFSGGEPMLQFDFLLEVLKACKKNGYHTAVDTSGHSSKEKFMAVMPYTDLFLFDLKHADDSKHIEYTGASNREIIGNLRILLKAGKDVNVRIPVIPGKNDDPENMSALKEILDNLKCGNLNKINLLPYHRTGRAKYKKFNIPYRMEDTKQPSPEKMKLLKEYFSGAGFNVKVGG